MRHYQHRFRKSNKDLNDDIDTEVDRKMSLGLSERYQREIMQNAHFADGIQNQINHFVAKVFRTKMNQNTKDRNKTDTDKSNVNGDEPILSSEISYPVETGKFNSTLASKVLENTLEDKDDIEESRSEHDTNVYNASAQCNI